MSQRSCHARWCSVKTAAARRQGVPRTRLGDPATRSAPGGWAIPRPLLRESARNAGCPMHPWAWTRAVVGRSDAPGLSDNRDQPAFRTRWVYDLLREAPGGRPLWFDHRSRGLNAPWLPSLRGDSRSAAPWRKAMRRENATWAVRAGVVVLSGGARVGPSPRSCHRTTHRGVHRIPPRRP